ncbi:MAG: hypothetical protein AB1427_00955 [Thermodesulfobacteriota bacterium]
MLTKKDKAWLAGEIKGFFLSEAFESMLGNMVMKALYQSQEREMTIEDGKSEPGRTIEKTVKVNVIDQIVKYLPFVEGALRGMQEDLDKTKNHVAGNNDRLQAIGNVLVGMEGSAKRLAEFSDMVKQIEAGNAEFSDKLNKLKMIKGSAKSDQNGHEHLMPEVLTPTHEEEGCESHTR